MAKVAIIGRSISAMMTAAKLKKDHPDLDVCMIGPKTEKRPVVGESIVELTSALFHELGLAGDMTETQYHKIGLSFFFKENLKNPQCRRYAVHEAQRGPAMPAYMLNRATFDPLLSRRCQELGVETVHAMVRKVGFSTRGPHRLELANLANPLLADWVVDCSGRSRVLARQLQLQQTPKNQRSAFWFRIDNFDRNFLDKLKAVKDKTWTFDSYYATLHFLGEGYWIWCIPLRTEGGRPTMSVGLVWSPAVLQGTAVRSADDFLARTDRDHPVISDLVRSGTIVDQNFYGNYMHEARHVYSEDGWFLIGDAGDTVDPLYSTGMLNTTVQIEQVSEMIRRDQAGTLDSSFVSDMERGYKGPRNAFLHLIDLQYGVMHDAYSASWHMHLFTMFYFYALLPMWFAGYHRHAIGARLLATLVEKGRPDYETLVSLLPKGRARMPNFRSEDIPSLYEMSVNWDLNMPKDHAIPQYMATMMVRYAKCRLQLLRAAGFPNWHAHLTTAALDVIRAGILAGPLRGRSLKELPLLHRLQHVPAVPVRVPRVRSDAPPIRVAESATV